MSTLVDFRDGWKNRGEQQDITKKVKIYQKCGYRQMDSGQG